VENQELILVVEERLDQLWVQLCRYRANGDWKSYWAARHAWISTGRYLSQLRLDALSEVDEQLALVDTMVGRKHDTSS